MCRCVVKLVVRGVRESGESENGVRKSLSNPKADSNTSSRCRTTARNVTHDAGNPAEIPGRIPKGFCNKAQGYEGRATLGLSVRSITTLKGLRPKTTAAQRGHNPVGVVKHRPPLPRASHSSQPWAL